MLKPLKVPALKQLDLALLLHMQSHLLIHLHLIHQSQVFNIAVKPARYCPITLIRALLAKQSGAPKLFRIRL
jgi:hypothetical protein